jgi:hypothetical protein
MFRLARSAEAVGNADLAERAWRDGAAWLQRTVLPDLPSAFLPGFLERVPAARALLARSSAG